MQWQHMENMKWSGAVLLMGAIAVASLMALKVVSELHFVPVGLAVGGLAVAALGSFLQIHRIRFINTVSAEALHRRVNRG